MTDETEAKPGGVRWALVVLFGALAILALVNARSASSWLDQQPPTSSVARLKPLADGWLQRTVAFGLDRPRATVAGLWSRAQALSWDAAPGRDR
jgi:hypothetical protein